jgi:hypothetical protein
VAVFGERGVHLPTISLREFLDFALRLWRVARRWLSEEEARQRVYGVFEQQVPYFFTLRIFYRDFRALVDAGAICFTLSKCAYDALHLMDDVYAFSSASWRAYHKLTHFSAWMTCRSWA